MRSKGRVVLLSQHYYGSTRRAGFHAIADAYAELGWDVTFATVALSHLSRLVGDHRLQYPVREEANRLVRMNGRLNSFVLYTPFHPANLRASVLNVLASPIWRRYGRSTLGELAYELAKADLIIFESSPGLVLFDQVHAMNRTARLVYRVSDDLRLLKNHAVVLDAERRASPNFDLISVPVASMLSTFAGLNVRVQPHGVDLELFSKRYPNPYRSSGPNAVFIGVARLDRSFLELALRATTGWEFHIFGRHDHLPSSPRLHAHGEVTMQDLVPWVQHADAGLHTLEYSPGAEVFVESLKVQQYSACRLPIILPEFMHGTRANMVSYRPGDIRSVGNAFAKALTMDRQNVPIPHNSWRALALALAGEMIPQHEKA